MSVSHLTHRLVLFTVDTGGHSLLAGAHTTLPHSTISDQCPTTGLHPTIARCWPSVNRRKKESRSPRREVGEGWGLEGDRGCLDPIENRSGPREKGTLWTRGYAGMNDVTHKAMVKIQSGRDSYFKLSTSVIMPRRSPPQGPPMPPRSLYPLRALGPS